jgi:hypothetical protein
VQTCSLCHTQSADPVQTCPKCKADLRKLNTVMAALKKFQQNPRVKNVRLVVADDSCPTCQQSSGTYEKKSAPSLPHEACSHAMGCRCFYEPMLDEIYP